MGLFNGAHGEHEKRIHAGHATEGDADAILDKAIRAGDRGASLSEHERGVLDVHYPGIFEDPEMPPQETVH